MMDNSERLMRALAKRIRFSITIGPDMNGTHTPYGLASIVTVYRGKRMVASSRVTSMVENAMFRERAIIQDLIDNPPKSFRMIPQNHPSQAGTRNTDSE